MTSCNGLDYGEAARVVCESADPILSPAHARRSHRRLAIGMPQNQHLARPDLAARLGRRLRFDI